MRPVGFAAELGAAPFGELGEIAVEPDRLGVALEGEDVRADPVEEPPVVAHHQGRRPRNRPAPPRGRASCSRRGRSSARREGGRWRSPAPSSPC